MSIWFIIIASISSILASMGVGGGGLFIILGTMFLSTDQKEMQLLNLFMFVASGIVASLVNVKGGNIFKKEFFQIIPFLLIGVLIGNMVVKDVDSEKLHKYFLIFIIIIGIYEIVSSLIRMKNAKNNSVKQKS